MNKSRKRVRNLFTSRILGIKLVVKELESAKFYAILLVSVMITGVFSLSPTIPSLINGVTASLMDIVSPWNATVKIDCTGRIATPTTAPISCKSEVRGVFVHCGSMNNPDWDIIAQTLANYKIDAIYGEFLGFGGGYYGDSPYGDQLGLAIDACHAKGIEVHVAMSFFFVIPSNHPELHAEDHAGNVHSNWICPTKQGTRDVIQSQVEHIATNYDIDGFMFDYIRYTLADMCYCSECRAKFQEWLGEGEIADWTIFHPDGSRYNEFMEWRIIPITEMVRDVRNWMLAIKPDLEFSAAVFTLYGPPPNYSPTARRYWLGQDTADWVGEGYLDVVAPMMYTTQITEPPGDCLDAYIEASNKYFTDGPEGKIPLVAFLTTGVYSPVQVDSFKAVVDYARSKGVDGFIIWRYGGPGNGEDSPAYDITPYLSVLDMPDVLTLSDITVHDITETHATIVWTTDLPATSKVEYSTSPLFNASFKYWSATGFHYWDVDNVPGTIVEDETSVTEHIITLTSLLPRTKYYFRVQSEDSSGIATSKVLTFTTG